MPRASQRMVGRMSKLVTHLVAALLTLALTLPALAQDAPAPRAEPAPALSYDPRPLTGVAGVFVGIGGLVFSAIALAGIGLCYADPFGLNADVGVCIAGQGVLAAGGLTVGIVGLSIGLPRYARYKAWRARQRSLLDGFNVASSSRGAALTYRLEF